MIEEEENENHEDVVFLYKLIPGICTNSYGIHCAKKSGIPLPLIKRAEEISQKREKRERITRLQTENSEQEESYFKKIVDMFLEFDCKTGDLKELMTAIRSKS